MAIYVHVTWCLHKCPWPFTYWLLAYPDRLLNTLGYGLPYVGDLLNIETSPYIFRRLSFTWARKLPLGRFDELLLSLELSLIVKAILFVQRCVLKLSVSLHFDFCFHYKWNYNCHYHICKTWLSIQIWEWRQDSRQLWMWLLQLDLVYFDF